MNKLQFSKRYTPESISRTKDIFSIPIYQRLFEWDEPRITQLLYDLKKSYLNTIQHPKPYYIGMLTSNRNNELIDGQQRYTVMMLLGIVMVNYYSKWNQFLEVNDELRLFFPSRTDDNKYLKDLMLDAKSSTYDNLYMKLGVESIKNFFAKELSEIDKSAFSQYVFKNLSFFISRLPQDYSSKALNKYFETMNSTGKNLENHEILKVDILKSTTRFDKAKLAEIWNAVSDMDQRLIRRRSKDERQSDLVVRFRNAYYAAANEDINLIFDSQSINKLSEKKITEGKIYPKIGKIKAEPNKPSQQRLSKNNGFHSIISFSEFLLQVLWIVIGENRNSISTDEFFDVNNLQETFKKYWSCINPDSFILSLLRYRLLYDRYVINISNDDSNFDLELSDDNTDDEGNTYHDNLLMYEAMLYVNSSAKTYYFWLPELLKYVDGPEHTCFEIYEHIRGTDELRHPFSVISDPDNLSYKVVDRYWFWKLDFIIWQKRRTIFPDENVRIVADHYSFRRTRSIEHIAPQTPDEKSTLDLTEGQLNCFGNLVMISSAQNSGLSNSTFAMKHAKVESHINKELNGTIESLKMLMIYQYDKWNWDTIQDHQAKCILLLEESFLIFKKDE